MSDRGRSLAAVHAAVLLFGVAGLFGKFVDASPALIVFGRTLFASAALLLVQASRGARITPASRRDAGGLLLIGGLLAAHWVTFFYAIAVSSVATGLLAFSSVPVFVTFLEPLLLGGRVRLADVALTAILVTGLLLMVPTFELANRNTLGVACGVVSGLLFALLSILNRSFASRYPPLALALGQDAIACALLLPWVWSGVGTLASTQWLQLAALGVVCTALAHTLFIYSMRCLTARIASMIACLEPVYGIVFAFVLLHEAPTLKEALGGVVIIGTTFYSAQRA